MRAAGARANRRRGEIEAVIDGEQRILCLMLDALAELETAFSADNLVGLAERFSRGQLKAADMIRIIGAGLRGGVGKCSSLFFQPKPSRHHAAAFPGGASRVVDQRWSSGRNGRSGAPFRLVVGRAAFSGLSALNTSTWSDGANWRIGHWLNGRLGGGTPAEVVAAVLREHGFDDFDVSEVSGDLSGYVQGDSARSLI